MPRRILFYEVPQNLSKNRKKHGNNPFISNDPLYSYLIDNLKMAAVYVF